MSFPVESGAPVQDRIAVRVVGALSVCHLLNDMVQSLLPAIYPILKTALGLSFVQIGTITLVNNLTASVLQPIIGFHTDRRPRTQSLAAGMSFTLAGLLLLAWSRQFAGVLAAATLIGIGSSIFHPESSRIARIASGGRHGLAQSLFQVGGNAGSAIGPLLAALIVLPRGQQSLALFAVVPLVAIALMWRVGQWYGRRLPGAMAARSQHSIRHALATPHVRRALGILLVLVFSKYVYLACFGTFYTFYLIETFGVSVRTSQLYLFVFLGAVAVGTILGGPIGDRYGRKVVIWGSILGVLPFTLALPYVSLAMTGVLSAIIGLILASAFSAIIVYGQELVPGHVGTISGLFFGLAFGIGGLGAAALGAAADVYGITFVYRVCAWLPALGLLTAWLPDTADRSG